MQWTLISLAGALSFSTVSALIDPAHDTKLIVHPRAHLYSTDGIANAVSQQFEKHNATASSLYSRTFHNLFSRQAAGRCGADFSNQRCGGNQCCSSYGYCGSEFEHCGVIVGCQPDFGRCGDAAPEPTTTPSPTPTPTPTPTPLPPTSSVIVPSSSSALPPLPSGTLIPSTNGQCGNATTCAGSVFGSCCSEYYYCGNSLDFCGSGCRLGFGTCGGVVPPPPGSSSSVPIPVPPSSSSSRPSPTPTPTPTSTPTPTPTPSPTSSAAPVPTNVSTSGRCGADGNGQTCTGSTFGRCCSSYGWCGSGQDDYCRLSWGCQPQFGTCG